MTYEDQLLIARNSLRDAETRLQNYHKWIEETKAQVEFWQDIIKALEAIQGLEREGLEIWKIR